MLSQPCFNSQHCQSSCISFLFMPSIYSSMISDLAHFSIRSWICCSSSCGRFLEYWSPTMSGTSTTFLSIGGELCCLWVIFLLCFARYNIQHDFRSLLWPSLVGKSRMNCPNSSVHGKTTRWGGSWLIDHTLKMFFFYFFLALVRVARSGNHSRYWLRSPSLAGRGAVPQVWNQRTWQNDASVLQWFLVRRMIHSEVYFLAFVIRNIFDWICYALLTTCVITHLVDIWAHTNFVARLHIQIMAVTIIVIWLRLMKNARAFSTLGTYDPHLTCD